MFCSLILVKILDKILNFKFSRDADVWLRLRSLILVEILKLGLVKILKFKFS